MVTIGPSTDNEAVLRQLLDLGVGQFRFAASKLGFDALSRQADRVRSIARSRGIDVETWLDLPGTKPRLDVASTGAVLVAGDGVRIEFGHGCERSSLRVLGMDPSQIELEKGDVFVIGDGEQALEVRSLCEGGVDTVVLFGGTLGKAKGICIAGKPASNLSLSASDLAVLGQIEHSPFTGVIVSFCQTATDVDVARSRLAADSMRLMAKIESVEGARNAREIAAAADAVLLGRGDLLLDSGPIDFHACCQQALMGARAAGTPAYVGTQLLPSLSTMWLPHRSELSCLSQLIADGIDGLMLANETSTGAAPLRTVSTLLELVRRYGQEQSRP